MKQITKGEILEENKSVEYKEKQRKKEVFETMVKTRIQRINFYTEYT